ncbi:hypothetical protein Tco_1563578 [Tanacetum coccineum]
MASNDPETSGSKDAQDTNERNMSYQTIYSTLRNAKGSIKNRADVAQQNICLRLINLLDEAESRCKGVLVGQDKAYEWTVDELEHTAKALGYVAVKFLERYIYLHDIVEYGDEKSKLLLCEATAVVMKKCFHLLGITPICKKNNYLKEKESETTSAAKVPFKEKHNIDARVENGGSGNWAPPNVSVPLLNLVDKVFQLNRWGWLRTLTRDFEEAIFDEEVLAGEAISLSDEEIAQDEAASEHFCKWLSHHLLFGFLPSLILGN